MFGVEVAYDNDKKGALSRIQGVSEGLNTIKSLKHYSEKYKTNVPVLDCIYHIIIKENDPISLLEAINT